MKHLFIFIIVENKNNHAHCIGILQIRYTSINLTGIHGLRKSEAEYESYFGGHWHKNRIWTG
jgi:hypothetical protein